MSKTKKIVGIILSGILLIFVGFFIYFTMNPIVLRSHEIICEYKKEFKPEEAIRFVFLGQKEDVDFKGDIDINKLGSYKGQYLYKGKSLDVMIEVKDLKAPVLKVSDYTTDLVENVEPNMFVKEIKDDTKVKLSFQEEVEKKKGKTEVTIIATDESKNQTTKTVTLQRKEDKKAPEVEFNGELFAFVGEECDLKQGLVIKDDMDASPVVEIDEANINYEVPGQYLVNYMIKDRSGNETKIERTIEIKSNEELVNKVVYLTFDDGPSNNTAKVIDILNQYGAKGTFFVTGNNPSYNSNIKKAFDAGHTIGLHTYTHDYGYVYSSIDAYFEDLESVNDMVESITGQRSNVIRFPGGSSNTVSANYSGGIMSKLVKEVNERGYQYFDWNCDSTDASGNNVPVGQLVANATSGSGQYINILFHDTDAKNTTVEALPKIIEYYKSKGYIFLGLNSNSFAPHHGVNN